MPTARARRTRSLIATVVLLLAISLPASAQKLLYGFIDRTGAFVIPPQYDTAWSFHNGVSVVRDKDYARGVIDRRGALVLKLDTHEILAAPPSASVFMQRCYQCAWVLLDSTGKQIRQIRPPTKVDTRQTGFTGRMALVDSAYDKYWIDEEGRAFPFLRDYSYFEEEGFSEGLKRASHDKARRAGFFNERMEIAIPFTLEFNGIRPFQRGFAIIESRGRYGAIDRTGRVVVKPEWKSLRDFGPAGLAMVREDDKFGLIDSTGAVVLPPQFSEIVTWNGLGQIVVVAGSEQRILDRSGRTLLTSPRTIVAFLDDSILLVQARNRNEFALMDVTGRIIADTIPGRRVERFSEGLALVGVYPADERMAAIHKVFADDAARRAAEKEQFRKDSIVLWERAHPVEVAEAKAAARRAADAVPPGMVRWVYYIVRQSIAAGSREVQVGGSKIKMRSVTWYVDYGTVDGKPDLAASAVSGLFEAPRRSLTVKAGEGVFVLDEKAGSVVDQALKRSGVGKTDADYLDANFLGKKSLSR
jgi:hypothetical protein